MLDDEDVMDDPINNIDLQVFVVVDVDVGVVDVVFVADLSVVDVVISVVELLCCCCGCWCCFVVVDVVITLVFVASAL